MFGDIREEVKSVEIADLNTPAVGENPDFLVYGPDGKEDRVASRRVEIYLYASQEMIDAANAGTLQ